jgi:hypothetical protein
MEPLQYYAHRFDPLHKNPEKKIFGAKGGSVFWFHENF